MVSNFGCFDGCCEKKINLRKIYRDKTCKCGIFFVSLHVRSANNRQTAQQVPHRHAVVAAKCQRY